MLAYFYGFVNEGFEGGENRDLFGLGALFVWERFCAPKSSRIYLELFRLSRRL